MIGVVDYGAGNLRSVCNALEVIERPYRLARSPGELDRVQGLLLPGVGHFGQMIQTLGDLGFIERIRADAASGMPLIGICLGMQALFESSEEAPGVAGLALLPGEVVRFTDVPRVPHMGWNDVVFSGSRGVFYFANSFYAPISDWTIGTSEYGLEFSAAVQRDNISGVQFHPEKSGQAGLNLLNEWCSTC